MHRHLITVEVRVIGGTDQWMELNGFTFNQNGLKRLDTQPMERRRAVQEHGMLANHFSQDIPYFRCLALDHFLSSLNGRRQASGF